MHGSTHRVRCWLLVAILASALVAGCTSPSGTGPASTVSAVEALDAIEAEAEAWQADAELVLVSGVEASSGSTANREVPDEEGRSSPATAEDLEVGDGRAPSWIAMFYSEQANTTRSFRVTPDGLQDVGPADPPAQTPRPLANWSVDSSDAVGTALGNASFRQAALAGDGTVVMTLGMQGGVPAWQLVARSHVQGAHTQLIVHAANGTLLGPSVG